jgi:uncharacterized protein (DUF1330 family)
MPALIVFMRDRVRDKAEFDVYSGLAGATLAGHTVKPLVAYNRCETLEGAPTEGAVILEFPSVDAAKARVPRGSRAPLQERRLPGVRHRDALIRSGGA